MPMSMEIASASSCTKLCWLWGCSRCEDYQQWHVRRQELTINGEIAMPTVTGIASTKILHKAVHAWKSDVIGRIPNGMCLRTLKVLLKNCRMDESGLCADLHITVTMVCLRNS